MTQYDSIYVNCPRCGEGEVEFKTQAGECEYLEFDLDSAPVVLLKSIIGQVEVCNNCHYNIHIRRYKPRQTTVEVV